MNSTTAAGTFVITLPKTFLDAITTKSMQACRVDVRCIGVIIEANGILELFFC